MISAVGRERNLFGYKVLRGEELTEAEEARLREIAQELGEE